MASNMCVMCNCTDNLNNTLTLVLEDGTKVVVYLCDTHAEDTTIKMAKTTYLDKKKRIDALLNEAAALGAVFNTTASGLVYDTPKAAPKPPPQIIEESTDDMLDSSEADRIGINPKLKNIAGASVNSTYNISNLKNAGKISEGKTKLDIVNIRGVDTPMPTKKIDNTGTTTVIIDQSMDTIKMAKRFREVARNSTEYDIMTSYGAGYQFRPCHFCNSTGEIVNRGVKQTCGKCHGTGEINV